MKEIRAFILLLVGVIMLSCSERDDMKDFSLSSDSGGKKSVGFTLRSYSAESSSATIGNFSVYAFVKDTIVGSTSGSVSENAAWNIELPLDELVTLFAVANATELAFSDSLSKTQIMIDNQGQNEVFMSGLVNVVSDNSIDSVDFELTRAVGQVAFEPKEDEVTLNAATQFDAIDVVFLNMSVSYVPGTNSVVQDTLTIRTSKAEGYKAAVFSFPTLGRNPASIEIIYYKNGQVVNKTIRALDVAVNVEASKRSVIYMPLLDESYLENTFPMTSSSYRASKKTSGVTLKEFQF